MTHPIRSAFETVRYWAGQRLLHSPFHAAYLKLTGGERREFTYEAWLEAEGRERAPEVALPEGYRLVLPEGTRLARDAGYWFRQAVEASGADVVYTDEDVLGRDGRRRVPVFKPAWSPELFRHCNYLGGAYLIRKGMTEVCGVIVHIPKVLVHRAESAVYGMRPNGDSGDSSGCPLSVLSVIVCSRTPELVAQCFEAIRTTTAYPRYELVLVDHGVRLAPEPGVRVVPYGGEFNFARMCNLGARAAGGELLLFLNDDTAPLDPDWMGLMAAQAVRADVGAVGALLTYPDKRIQHAGIYLGTPNGAGHPGRLSEGSPMWPWLRMTREQLAVTGACLMTRREVFERVGGFDESFPVNYNDVDFCLKCAQAGYKVILEARARVEHKESASRTSGIRYQERRRFLDRWAEAIDCGDPYWSPNLSDNELLLPSPEAVGRVKPWR